MALLAMIFVALASIIVSFYLYRKFFAFKEFKREGIPGPKPHWLIGNLSDMADESKRHLVIPGWTKKYGRIYGYYEGSTPTLVTTDLDFITQVYVKQFSLFHGHKLFPLQDDPDATDKPINVLIARGDRWKRLRTIANPMFSAGKLKSLMPLMEKCQGDFMTLIDESAAKKQEFNIFECFKFLTLDTIAETAFGVELDSAKTRGKNNPIYDSINEMFSNIFNASVSMKVAMVLPELYRFITLVETVKSNYFGAGVFNSRDELGRVMKRVINDRKARTTKRMDLLQMMLEVEESVADPTLLNGLKGLSEEEILGQGMIFMIAGFETSSNALAFCSHFLANYTDAQDKVLAEIDAMFPPGSSKKADYDSVGQMTYLEAVINETLRIYPVAPLVVTRLAMEDAVINGVHVEKGMNLIADIWSLHRDEEQWGPVDVERFHPERFLDDYPTKLTRHEAAFMPFGFGPRICLGMRFGMLEMKLTLVNLLRKYRIEKSPQTGDKLKLMAGFTITPSEGVWVKLVQRN